MISETVNTVLGGLLAGGVGVLVWRYQSWQNEVSERRVFSAALLSEINFTRALIVEYLEQTSAQDIVLDQIINRTNIYKANAYKLGIFGEPTARKLIEYFSQLEMIVLDRMKNNGGLNQIIKNRMGEFKEIYLRLYEEAKTELEKYT